MAIDQRQILLLSKEKISTKDIIVYLESVNLANLRIFKVLVKKPILPDYDSLEWVINFKKDLAITKKLKSSKKLNVSERLRLKNTLSDARGLVKKLYIFRGIQNSAESLERYIKNI